jgi:hypothetical protein
LNSQQQRGRYHGWYRLVIGLLDGAHQELDQPVGHVVEDEAAGVLRRHSPRTAPVHRRVGDPKLDPSAGSRCEPAIQANAIGADVHDRDHDCETVAVKGDRPGPILTSRAGADQQILLEASYLDVDVFERDRKSNTLV